MLSAATLTDAALNSLRSRDNATPEAAIPVPPARTPAKASKVAFLGTLESVASAKTNESPVAGVTAVQLFGSN